ncbi:MAG: hypothetical protein ABIS06_01625 [Vicinamibacterales bacterium]
MAETEAVVRPEATPSVPAERAAAPVEAPAPRVVRPEPESKQTSTPRQRVVQPAASTRQAAERSPVWKREQDARVEEPIAPVEAPNAIAPPLPPAEPAARVEPATPAVPALPQFEEIVLPAATVIGLEVETPMTSERAQVEDRVDARVTRDVYVDGRLVIPSRSRMIGAVTLVERGGKVKERARLGVRFHTLVLDGGRQVAVRTETIMREGEPPSGESSKKIGGAAIGGAVLGAIIGGGKGAVLGGAAGAAGGTAAVMAGGRNPATLAGGTIVTARLSGPVAIDVEKR